MLPLLVDSSVLLPVDDEGGEVGGYQSVHSGRGPAEKTVTGGNGAGYGAQQHPGHVESEELHLAQPASLGELQGDTHHQLHRHVEANVLLPRVDKLVGEEPPGLLPLFRVVDQVGTVEAGEVSSVPDVETSLIIQIIYVFFYILRDYENSPG